MKKALLTLLVVTVSALSAFAKSSDNDPVLMTINKKPVKLSEFEYLYQKNNAQQLQTQPLDEYVDLFVIYKLKVADAEAAGIDQTEAFKNEFAGYRRDLSEPYLTDKEARDSLEHLIYDRLGEEILVSHIMVDRGKDAKERESQRQMLDQVRNDILAGKVTFEQMVDSISIDPGKVHNHGSQGYITSSAFPYTFEDAAYLTPVGEISEVVETPFGLHIVKVVDRRENPGQVKVQHILKLTQGLSEEEQAQKKAEIDAIYEQLIAGGNFDDIAKAESEDPGSARAGGHLDWFGRGRMVPEFEETSYALAKGEISKPFRTSYGWHIIHKIDARGLEPFDVMQPRISRFIDRDERQNIPVRQKQAKLRAKYSTTINADVVQSVKDEITAAGSLDSAMVQRYSSDIRPIVTLKGDNKGANVSALFESLSSSSSMTVDQAIAFIDERIEVVADETTIEAERCNLANENPEFRNLLNEYRDGMLLFEISDRNVWSKSKTDVAGLNAYFNANKDKYATWKSPKFKGYVVFTTSDSLKSKIIHHLIETCPEESKVSEVLRKEFGKEVKVERVLASKGENAIIDAIAFGGEKPAPTTKWVAYFPYFNEVIEQPEEPADDRGAVTTDYQNALEQEWISELRKQYEVKINNKVLKQYKESLAAETPAETPAE